MLNPPMPENEMERILSLSSYDLDYSNLQDSFKDLTKLAAKVAGTDISLVNLIDTFTQWTVSKHGYNTVDQMPREESVCQYMIATGENLEIKDLSADDRFKDRPYVTDGPNLRYYFGVPLQTSEGHSIGALCVLDTKMRTLSPEKMELLKIIADEIVNRLNGYKVIDGLKGKLAEANESKKKVAHDIRGPLGGIIGLAQVISDQGKDNQLDEVLEFINLIQRSGRSLLELADEILGADKPKVPGADEFNLLLFKDKLERLYAPQAKHKNITFEIIVSPESASTPFSKRKLLQITGNLISNAIKFTPYEGTVTVDLHLTVDADKGNVLQIRVSDTGVGIDKATIDTILNGSAQSTKGTGGEEGYGFGLELVKHLVNSLKGTMAIFSEPGHGTAFKISLPQE